MTVSADVPAFEDMTFPDAMPANPTLSEEGYYDYDDMSVHYDLIFSTYSYGVALPEEDPIKNWLENKYNVTIDFRTPQSTDVETDISTAFAGETTADVYAIGSGYKSLAFTLAESGLLVDAKEMLPYMPQTSKFVTNTLLKYMTMEDGQMPFVTKYAIQDGDIWNLAIRQDWLDALEMEAPTTKEELLEYARAVTKNDPDGNGVDDTYFMLGAGTGTSFNMLEGLMKAFGNASYYVAEDGTVANYNLDGTRKEYLEFLNTLYTEGLMPADWYTISWENAKSYTLNDKIGMVNYPAPNLYGEYYGVNNDATKLANWKFLAQMPIEGGKGAPGGNAGTLYIIPKANIGEDTGKLARICHILDAMCYGGEAYFQTVQNGSKDVWEAAGYENVAGYWEFTEEGRSFCYIPGANTENPHPVYSFDSTGLSLAPWQNFGYTLKWQDEYATNEAEQIKADLVNEANATLAQMERWENTALLYTLPSEVTSTLNEWVAAQEYSFVVGEKSFDEWDSYVEKWLEQGGVECLKAAAAGLGCELPEGIE
jgi:hypothetical protein